MYESNRKLKNSTSPAIVHQTKTVTSSLLNKSVKQSKNCNLNR